MLSTPISTSLSWVEVSREALLHNLRIIRQKLGPGVGVAAVLKANAYGHGYAEVSHILNEQKLAFFAVHSFEEAALLRQLKSKPEILIVGYTPLKQLKDAVERGFHLTVYNAESIRRIGQLGGDLRAYAHLKLETGTNRQGIDERSLPEFLDLVKSTPTLQLVGASTHFANIEDTTDHTYAQQQLDRYNRMIAQIESAGFELKYKHTASSAASLLFAKTHFNLIRFGVSLYGLWPSKETYLSYRLAGGENELLRPALTWKTVVAQIKEVPKGSFVGYGCSYRTTADSRIAILPMGYFDGYDRKLSNLGHVLIRGQRAPVRGRVCMDIVMVDVTNIPDVGLEDEVVLLGKQGEDEITAEQMAGWAQTINYEVMARISPLLPRMIV